MRSFAQYVISQKQKKILQKGKRHSFFLCKAFQISRNYFLLHIGTLTFSEQRVEAKSTIILGDSTIKFVDTRRMRSKGKNAFRKYFPSSSTEDMKHYMVPSLAKDPDQVVIHIRTSQVGWDDHSRQSLLAWFFVPL